MKYRWGKEGLRKVIFSARWSNRNSKFGVIPKSSGAFAFRSNNSESATVSIPREHFSYDTSAWRWGKYFKKCESFSIITWVFNYISINLLGFDHTLFLMNATFLVAAGYFAFPRCVWTQHDAACGGGSLHYLATGVAADGTEGIPGIFYTEAS